MTGSGALWTTISARDRTFAAPSMATPSWSGCACPGSSKPYGLITGTFWGARGSQAMRILVTGGAGFIGSHTVDALLARGDTVVCADNFNEYYSPQRKRKNLAQAQSSASFCLYESDVRDVDAMAELFESEKPDKVIHMAAMAGVRNSVAHPLLYEEANVRGTLNLLELASRTGVRNFVLASTSSVYGASAQVPFTEDDPAIRPLAPYPATKTACELLRRFYHSLYGLRCTALRLFSVYGPRGRPHTTPHLVTGAI